MSEPDVRTCIICDRPFQCANDWEEICFECAFPGIAEEMKEPDMSKNGGVDRMLKWFEYGHLGPEMQQISRPFHDLAWAMVEKLEPGPERTVMLRKLLEAKDAAVRARVHPGG